MLLTGANSIVGRVLRERLAAAGFDVTPAGRRSREPEWLTWDMSNAFPAEDRRIDLLIHAAPLWFLPPHLEALADTGVKRVICFSSTSAVTKEASTDGAERQLAQSLSKAEVRLLADSSRLGIDTTVLRPTLIYGFGRDKNISVIARFIKRRGFFPVAGPASGGRQPLHATDAAEAAVAVVGEPATFGKTYVIAGGETLTYREMVGRLFDVLDKPRRIVAVPVWLYRVGLDLASALGKSTSGAMARRMNQDLVFDHGEAERDFGFSPEAFLEHPDRDVVPA